MDRVSLGSEPRNPGLELESTPHRSSIQRTSFRDYGASCGFPHANGARPISGRFTALVHELAFQRARRGSGEF